jgi:enamine deaminase RidA (YjgF/YER057c/UK114 family)
MPYITVPLKPSVPPSIMWVETIVSPAVLMSKIIYFSGRIGAAAGDEQSDMHLDLLRKHLRQVFRHHRTTFEKDGTFLNTSTATGRVRK